MVDTRDVQRTRECTKGHRFETIEIPAKQDGLDYLSDRLLFFVSQNARQQALIRKLRTRLNES